VRNKTKELIKVTGWQLVRNAFEDMFTALDYAFLRVYFL
jgi:hypothetical protein